MDVRTIQNVGLLGSKNELIYRIGEAIMLEIEEVEDILYPKGENECTEIFIKLNNGKQYKLRIILEK